MKKSLRQSALTYRKQLSAAEMTALGQEISASLLTLLQTFKPCTVGLYYPTQAEPNLLQIMNSPALLGLVWALPVCCNSPTGGVLQFAEFSAETPLEAGVYNIPVPAVKHWVQPDVLLIPCVAFHQSGARLGYGAGWYDRTLSQIIKPPITVGIAYSKSQAASNFAEPHDHLLDYVVTEHAVINCRES